MRPVTFGTDQLTVFSSSSHRSCLSTVDWTH